MSPRMVIGSVLSPASTDLKLQDFLHAALDTRAGMGSGISIKAEADNEWRMLEDGGMWRTGMGSGISVKAKADVERRMDGANDVGCT